MLYVGEGYGEGRFLSLTPQNNKKWGPMLSQHQSPRSYVKFSMVSFQTHLPLLVVPVHEAGVVFGRLFLILTRIYT